MPVTLRSVGLDLLWMVPKHEVMKQTGATAKVKSSGDRFDLKKQPARKIVRAGIKPVPRRSSARAILKHSGTWIGDDAELLLKEICAVRGKATF